MTPIAAALEKIEIIAADEFKIWRDGTKICAYPNNMPYYACGTGKNVSFIPFIIKEENGTIVATFGSETVIIDDSPEFKDFLKRMAWGSDYETIGRRSRKTST